jgi:hypothetical protein
MNKMSLKKKKKIIKEWIDTNSNTTLFPIEKEITKLNKVKDVKSTSIRGIYHIELSKKKYVTECYKCRIWFRELCSTIAYFQSMENLLYDLGYDTGRENDKNKRDKSN